MSEGTLQLGKLEYSWIMASFGIAATLTSISLGNFNQRHKQRLFTGIGAALITLVLLPANWVNLSGLLLLWSIAGVGQMLVNVPTQTLIAERVAIEVQGRVYGAHFAWSHLWWAFSYPLAEWMGSHLPSSNFFYNSLVGAVFLVVTHLIFKSGQQTDSNRELCHEHSHSHDLHHQHNHLLNPAIQTSHSHLHFHDSDD